MLLHGGRHGGWCWCRVAQLLRDAGHNVWVPTLTGSGERWHLARPDVDLETHVSDLRGVLEYEDLTDTIVVAHSYGGMVATIVADRIPERVAHLIYLDAVVPRNGASVIDDLSPETTAALYAAARDGDGWLVTAQTPPSAYGIEDADDATWVASKLTAQPLATYTQPARITGAVERLPRTYISCTQTGPLLPPMYAEMARRAGWNMREIATGHDAMITAPVQVAEIVLEVAGG